MIVGAELRAWAADRGRHREGMQAIRRLAVAWQSGPVHRRFAESFAPLDSDDAEGVAEASRALFADHGWVDELIRTFTAALQRDPYFDPPFPALNSPLHSGLLVYDDDKVAIGVGVSRASAIAARKNGKRPATSVNLTGQVNVLKFIKAGGATLSFWEAPPIGRDFQADTAGRCRKVASRRIADGEIVTVDGRSQAYVIDHVRSNMLLVQAEVKAGRAPVSVEYDSTSLAYVGSSATDDSDSRIQMIATLVRKLGATDAVPVLTAFLDHPSFFVRWHVMRELLGLDVCAALPHLRRMAEADPHPDARQAAISVLGRAGDALGSVDHRRAA